MQPKALKELRRIMKEEDESERLLLLSRWEKDWIESISAGQYVINKSTMSSEELDMAWYMAATKCGEKVIDKAVGTHTMSNNEVRCKFYVIRSTRAKL